MRDVNFRSIKKMVSKTGSSYQRMEAGIRWVTIPKVNLAGSPISKISTVTLWDIRAFVLLNAVVSYLFGCQQNLILLTVIRSALHAT